MPIRVAANQRILKSVYKTYVDVIHIRKDRTARIANTAAREDREDQQTAEEEGVATAGERWGAEGGGDLGGAGASSAGPNAEAEFSPERVEVLEAIG